MKKAKEYAAQIIDSHYSEDSIRQVFHALVDEISEIAKMRNAASNKAARAIILGQQQKWSAICRIVNEKQPVLIENGFLKLLKIAIPEMAEILKSG